MFGPGLLCTIEPMLELASRRSGPLQVALMWNRERNLLAVSVEDQATGDRFELVVDDSNALDVYYHPYAYAALRGVEYTLAA
jgi:hypothetical protein